MSLLFRKFVLRDPSLQPRAYLDNAATTQTCNSAMERMIWCMHQGWGNPSAAYLEGVTAKSALERARSRIAECFGNLPPSTIHFTSSGTESNNIAIRATMKYQRARGKDVIITSSIEHSSVHNTASNCGCIHEQIPVDEDGMLRLDVLRRVLAEKAVRIGMISIILAHNEVGSIQNVHAIYGMARTYGILLHVDATQAVGKMPIDFGSFDMLTASSHKFHGPRGVGLLYIRNGLSHINKETTTMSGGGQEFGVRSGTENVPAIVGCAEALVVATKGLAENVRKMSVLKSMLKRGISEIVPGVMFNGSHDSALPNIVNFCLPDGLHAHEVVKSLDEMGVSVNSGSACTRMMTPSRTLIAMGRSERLAHGAIRVSVSSVSTMVDCEKFLSCLRAVLSAARR